MVRNVVLLGKLVGTEKAAVWPRNEAAINSHSVSHSYVILCKNGRIYKYRIVSWCLM